MLLKLLAELQQGEFESIVISLTDKGTIGQSIEKLGVPVYTLNMVRSKPSFSAYLRLRRLIKSYEPSIIQGWMYHGNLASSLVRISILRHMLVVWGIRQSLDHTAKEDEDNATAKIIRLTALLSRMPKLIIYNSQHGATQHAIIGYSRKRELIIPNGFNCSEFSPSIDKRTRIRTELGVPEGEILIGLIGRYHPVKDHKSFFRGAGILARKYENVSFLCAGSNVDLGNTEINTLVEENDLEGRVYLLGERPDIAALNASLDIASLSSLSESFPNVLGEAMACAVPCVVTDVGDSRSIVGDTGLVVSPADPVAMASAWASLIDMGQEHRRNLGRKARDRILSVYSLEHVGKYYETIYHRMIERDLPEEF